jgi:hypothetical protein
LSNSWLDHDCQSDGVTKAGADPKMRWETVETDVVMERVRGFYKMDDEGMTFGTYVSDKFHGPEGWQCHLIKNVPCSNTIRCNEVTVPGAFHLMNAFATIHGVRGGQIADTFSLGEEIADVYYAETVVDISLRRTRHC